MDGQRAPQQAPASEGSTSEGSASKGSAAVEREITRFQRQARAAAVRLAAEVHSDLDAAGYALLVSVLDLAGALPGGVRAANVSDATGLHKSTLSRGIAQLEELGLLERVTDPADARALLLRLTPSGRRSVRCSRDGRRASIARRMRDWPAVDVDQFADLLGRFNDDPA